LVKQLFAGLPTSALDDIVRQVQSRAIDPQTAVNHLLAFRPVDVAK